MNAEVQSQPIVTAPDRVRWRLPRPIAFVWKFVIGVLLIQSFLGAFLVMGWLWRVSQRFVMRSWWKRSRKMSWREFIIDDSWPNWILGSRDTKKLRTRLFGSLGRNFKTGVQAFFNTALILGPASALWIFSWSDGWNNWIKKGYE